MMDSGQTQDSASFTATSEAPRGPSQSGQNQQIKFTHEELTVIKQCNTESFFQRSLPMGSGLGLATYALVQSGYLKGHSRWGSTPKVTLAVVVGYFLGKLSYQQKCAEKLMALPNSPIGDMLRRRRGHGETLSLDPGFSTPLGMVAEPFADRLQPQQSHLDLDADRPANEGLSDSGRPSLDDQALEEDIPLPIRTGPSTSYDELRRKNREEYELSKTKPYRTVGGDAPVAARARTVLEAPSSMPKNKYGDVWEQ